MSKSQTALGRLIWAVNKVLWHAGLTKVGNRLSRVTTNFLSEEDVSYDTCLKYFRMYSRVEEAISDIQEDLDNYGKARKALDEEDAFTLYAQGVGLKVIGEKYPHDLFLQLKLRRLRAQVRESLAEWAPGFTEGMD